MTSSPIFVLIREKAPRGKNIKQTLHCVSCDLRLSLYFYDEFRSSANCTTLTQLRYQNRRQKSINIIQICHKKQRFNIKMVLRNEHVHMHTYEHTFSICIIYHLSQVIHLCITDAGHKICKHQLKMEGGLISLHEFHTSFLLLTPDMTAHPAHIRF